MRFFRTFFILFFCFFIFYFAVYLYFKNEYPSEKISKLAQTWLSKQLEKPVQVEKGSFHLLTGFQVENIQVFKEFSSNQKLLTINKIELRYVWKSLLKKKLEVSKIIIKDLIFYLSNLDFQTTTKDTIQNNKIEPIDWQVYLKNIEIENAVVQYSSIQNKTSWKIFLEKLKLNISDLQLEQIDLVNLIQKISFNFQGQVNEGVLKFEFHSPGLFQLDSLDFAGFTLESMCDFDLKSEKHVASLDSISSDSINVGTNLVLSQNQLLIDWRGREGDSSELKLPALRIILEGFTFSDFRKAAVDLELSLKDWFYTRSLSEFENVSQTSFKLISDSAFVGVDSILKNIRTSSLFNQYVESIPEINGLFYLDSIKITGKQNKGSWEVAYQFRNWFEKVKVDFQNGININNLNGTLNHSGYFKNSTFEKGDFFAEFNSDSLLLFNQTRDTIISSYGFLEIKSNLVKNMVPESLFVKTEIEEIFGGNFIGTIDLFVQEVLQLDELDLQHITGNANFELNEMDLEQYTGNSISGFSDLSLNVQSNFGYSSNIVAKFNTTDLSVEFDTTEGFELLPDAFLQMMGELSSSPGFEEIKFQNAEFTFNDLSDCKIDASYFPALGESRIYLEDWFINLPVLQDYFPVYLRDELISSIWEGEATISCEMLTWQDENAKTYSQIIGDLNISNEIFDNPYWYIRLDSLNMYGIFAGSFNELQLDLEGNMKGFQIIDTTPNYLNTQLYSYLSIENWNDIYIQSFSAEQPKLNLVMNVEGSIQNLSEQPIYFLSSSAKVENDSAVQIILGTKIAGDVSTEFSIFSQEENSNILQVKGWIDLDTLDYLMDEGIQLFALKGHLPIDQLYDLDSGYLVPIEQTQQQKLRTDLFEVYSNYYLNPNTPYSILVVDSLIYENYKAENLEIFFENEQGSFFIPKISMNLYDGSLLMNSVVNLNSGAWNDISYQMQGQMSRVNSSILPGVQGQTEEESRIGIAFFMHGKGLDLSKKIELEGELNVTEIGSFTTENLLNSIDPTKTDPSIRSVRRMIGLGYKPNSISFLIQHDNFYPTISFRQPWYSPVRIAGGEIAISRLPIKFLLDLMVANVGSSIE